MATKTRPLATVNRKRRQRTTPRPLEVHVVEDHADALEHLYNSIGAKRTPFSNLKWVHFDSHPDLTLPRALTASTVRDPEALYEVLFESEGGNAEFILPAVFAGHVTKVAWVRPPWARQLPDGLYNFHVGVEKASSCLRVTLPAVYYLDEDLHCTLQDMEPGSISTLELRVCPIEDIETLVNDSSAAKGMDGWLLDICLDYYITENPFLAAVEAGGGMDARETVQAYFNSPRFRQTESETLPSPETVKCEMATFLRLTDELMDVAAATALSRCSSVEAGERGLGDITEDLLPLLVPGNGPDSVLSVITSFVKLLQEGEPALLESVRGLGHCACLPSHRSSWGEIEAMVSGTVNAVEALCQAHGAPPSIILLARSMRDGYTPPTVVGALQEKVLQALRSIRALGPLQIMPHYLDYDGDQNKGKEK
ncbi:upf0489 protein c5orf22 homolog [Nannochloropsis oceanica]